MSAAEEIDPKLVDAALAYAAKGLPVFPCHPETKAPLVEKGLHSASVDAEVIKGWWARWPAAMIGMPTGAKAGFWVLDIDDPEAFEAGCPIDIPPTRRCDTGKGYHLLFKVDPAREVRNKQRTLNGWPMPRLPGAEVRGEGGYVIVPPSLHPNGKRYQWHDESPMVAAPAALIRMLSEKGPAANDQSPPPLGQKGADTPYGLAALDGECASILSAGEGSQEGTLNAAALKIGKLVAGGELSLDTARSRLIAAGLAMPSHNPRDKWTAEKIAEKVERGLEHGRREPRSAPGGQRSSAGAANGPADPAHVETTLRERSRSDGYKLREFHAHLPSHSYIFAPTGELWPAASINANFAQIQRRNHKGEPVFDKKGEPEMMHANAWLDKYRSVAQMTWAPGEPQVIQDRLLIREGGWVAHKGCRTFNLYRPPVPIKGDRHGAAKWVDHVHKVYPEEAGHIIRWLAQRVQRPHEKINHAIVLGGDQGIGKDTILEPVMAAVGRWNVADVSPQQMLGRFNGFVKSVILRVSEARDLGEMDRFAFYDHTKTYITAPPDVHRVDEKHLREYAVLNVTGLIITTNHKTDGIYLPQDDRRHFVAWSNLTRADFDLDYWNDLYGWYHNGGIGHVAAYLAALDLSGFDPKAPPMKTRAFWDIVDANQAPEDAELADALDKVGRPPAVTVKLVAEMAAPELKEFLADRRNARRIPHRFEECGYERVRNPQGKDGHFSINGTRCVVYARRELAIRERLIAAESLTRGR